MNRIEGEIREAVVFAIKQRNIDLLRSKLDEVSYPSSPSYGKHLSKEEVASITSNKVACAAAKTFLLSVADLSIVHETEFCDYLIVDGSIDTWVQLFDASLTTDMNNADASFLSELKVPAVLSSHIEAILPRKSIPLHISPQIAYTHPVEDFSEGMPLAGFVFPQLLSALYGVKNNTGGAMTTQAVYAALQQTMSPIDLSLFQRVFNLPQDQVKDGRGHVDDETCLNDPQSCVEANLDTQYLTSTAQHTPTTFYYWSLPFDPFLSWIVTVANMKRSPRIWTISYGAEERFITKTYATLFDIEAMKLGLQGVTIFAASGDNGASCLEYKEDRQNNTMTITPAGCGQTCAIFPASSPFVTAVGATQGPESGIDFDATKPVTDDDASNNGFTFAEERVCMAGGHTMITSGGGFSSLHTRPPFQDDLVDTYLKRAGLEAGDQRFAGRAYPDLALLGHSYITISGLQALVVDGTSASTPVAAGLFSLINAAKLKNGGSTLGWLNPLLYSLPDDVFHDIVTGHNRCSFVTKFDALTQEYEAKCCADDNGASGFAAVEGYDPVTGRGSLHFDHLLAEILRLDTERMESSVMTAKSSVGDGIRQSLQFGAVLVGLLFVLIIGLITWIKCGSKRRSYHRITGDERIELELV